MALSGESAHGCPVTLTRWSIIRTRRFVASQEVARANAREATMVLAQRRLDHEDTERYLDSL